MKNSMSSNVNALVNFFGQEATIAPSVFGNKIDAAFDEFDLRFEEDEMLEVLNGFDAAGKVVCTVPCH